MAEKALRKELKEPDEFVSFTARVYQWMQKNWRLLAVAAGAVILAVVAAHVYNWNQARKEGQASALFVEAKKILDAPVSGDEALGQQSSTPGKYSSEKEKLQAALEKMNEVIEKYSSAKTALLARYYVGEIRRRLGEYDQAREAFEQFLNEAGHSSDFSAFALEGIAFCLEAQGKIKAARENYRRMTQPPFNTQPDRGLYHLARLAQDDGQADEARKIYEEILEKYPETAFRAEIENRLALLPPPADKQQQQADSGKDVPDDKKQATSEDESSGKAASRAAEASSGKSASGAGKPTEQQKASGDAK
ncbi:MAG: hypothetical protein DRI34_14710 [Deltaproteobacteria bacterium]|nr:MAG: hypothetical protein DRI34_14710 [Deltaproteobacteria bacterium]